VGLERGPLSFVSTTEELLERKNSGFGLGNQDYGRKDPSHWPSGSLYPQKLALTWPTSGGGSVGTVRLRTKATEFSYFVITIMPNIIHTTDSAEHAVFYNTWTSVKGYDPHAFL
jgi:hypothetical protein